MKTLRRKRNNIISVFIIIIVLILTYIAIIGIDNNSNKTDKNKGLRGSEVEQDIPLGLDHYNNQPKNNKRLYSEPVKVKGIYVSGWTAGTKTRLNELIEKINNTELNAMVIDIKEDKGKITHLSNVETVREIGAAVNMMGNVDEVIKKLKENKIFPIARIVAFKDPIAAEKRPDLAIKSEDGRIWRDNKGVAWLNPYNRGTWDYLIDISIEAANLGFMEIQYDYIRFPTDGNVKTIDYGSIAEEVTKADIISEFLTYAKEKLSPYVVDVSADIFVIVPIVDGDYDQIGQDLEMISKDIDYICPMVYPSHYANVAQNGVGQKVNGILYKQPDLEPYGVVYNTLVVTKEKLEASEAKAKVRSYLQDFSTPWLGKGNYQIYGGEQVRQQIQAVYDAGFEEWILWNPENRYSRDGLLEE